MSDVTKNLGLPLIAGSQAQKHVTHNEALTLLDALVQLACLDKDLAAPPANPAEGDRYLVVAASPTGAWTGLSGQIAVLRDGVWVGLAPRPGWFAFVADEAELYLFTGTAWTSYRTAITALQSLPRLGINTTADATNRLAVKADAALFSWDDVTPGTGSLRVTLNKKAAANDAGFALQTAFSTRGLFGALGSDDVTLKVSPDGTSFTTAMVAAAASAKVTFGAGIEGTNVGAVSAGTGRFTTLTATGTFSLQQGGVVGGVASAQRSATFDNFGRITWRFDDNGYVTGPILNNYGLTGVGQGAYVMTVNFGSGGIPVAQAGRILLVTTDAFTSTASASAKWQFQASTANSLASGLEVYGTYAATPLLSLTAKAADPTSPAPAFGMVYANSTITALRWYTGTAWARINNFAKFSAYANADTYAAAGTWTKVAFNNADSNDQGAFVPASNRFVAPEAGLYGFSVALVYKKNGTSAPTALEIQLYRNGAAAGRGRASATGTLVDGVTALDLSSTLKLSANDTVEVYARFTGADGYAAAADSFFGGQQMP